MNARSILTALSLAATLLVAGGRETQAGPIITVDEFGNGLLAYSGGTINLPSSIMADPGPGGLPAVLTYDLLGPPGLVAGDVLLQDGVGGSILDVFRFNPAGTGGNPAYRASLVVYSDNIDGFDAPGDTPSPPTAFYPNTVTILEIGPEGANGATYTPGPNDPGFVAFNTVTYNFVSDGIVTPEPSTLASCAVAAVVGLIVARRRKARAA